jgi:hypothetical protein
MTVKPNDIPTGPMTRALTDKERKAAKAEYWRLAMMLQDDTHYWRRGLTPPPRTPPAKPYTVNDLLRERPDLYDRTTLPKGDPNRLTLPKAKREAQKPKFLPPGIYHWDANGQPCSKAEAKSSVYTCTFEEMAQYHNGTLPADRMAALVADRCIKAKAA